MSLIDMVREPVPGEMISPSWARDVVRAIKASKVIPGPGVRVDYTTAGQRVRAVDVAMMMTGAEEEPWQLRITKDGESWTATVSNLYAGFATAHDEFNDGGEVSLTLTGATGDMFLGAEINMETHAVQLAEATTFEGITDKKPSRGSVIVKLPLYKLHKSVSGGYRKVMRLWDRPCIAWYE